MKAIKLIIEYDGTAYAGWQIQPGKRTIQGVLTKILEQITQTKVTLFGASRTDAGVHALGQVAHFQCVSPHQAPSPGTARDGFDYKLLGALNGLLPKDISVASVEEVPLSFHARKSAKKKTYRYLILNTPVRHALWATRAAYVREPLKIKAMQQGAKYLIGRHDFKAFQGRKPATKTTAREIYGIKLRGGEEGILTITITGNGFLKQMVRNIVGLLIEVGRGRRPPQDVKKVLASRDRKNAGVCAPARGLYLIQVFY